MRRDRPEGPPTGVGGLRATDRQPPEGGVARPAPGPRPPSRRPRAGAVAGTHAGRARLPSAAGVRGMGPAAPVPPHPRGPGRASWSTDPRPGPSSSRRLPCATWRRRRPGRRTNSSGAWMRSSGAPNPKGSVPAPRRWRRGESAGTAPRRGRWPAPPHTPRSALGALAGRRYGSDVPGSRRMRASGRSRTRSAVCGGTRSPAPLPRCRRPAARSGFRRGARPAAVGTRDRRSPRSAPPRGRAAPRPRGGTGPPGRSPRGGRDDLLPPIGGQASRAVDPANSACSPRNSGCHSSAPRPRPTLAGDLSPSAGCRRRGRAEPRRPRRWPAVSARGRCSSSVSRAHGREGGKALAPNHASGGE